MLKCPSNHRRWSPRPVWAILIVIAMVASATLPAFAGTVEEFTDETTEVVLSLDPGAPENTSRIAFPTDSRVRQASVTLRSDQNLLFTQVMADSGNVSGWSATPSSVDVSELDVDAFKGTPFSGVDLTKVSLNTTMSGKVTISSNASTHLFAFDVAAVLEGVDRDLNLVLDWTGMGTRVGTVAVDEVHMYVADFARDRWHEWDDFDRVPSTGQQENLATSLGPFAGWTDDDGLMYMLAAVEPLRTGDGASLTTSHMLLQIWSSQVPDGLSVDVGGDGSPEFQWGGDGVGLYGLQNVLEDGTTGVTADFTTQGEHVNLTSFLVPAGADLVEARVCLAGQPGDIVTSSDDEPSYISAHGMTSDTSVEDIPAYSHPTWAQVVMTNLKNAGMKDQAQETLRGAQSIGNYGAGDSSVAQTFTPSITGKIVFLNLSITGAVYNNPPDIVVEIRSVDGTGHPTEIIIGSSVISGSLVNESSTKWHTVHFTDVDLVQGTEYAIICSVPSASNLEYYEWKNHIITAGDPYPNGKAFIDDTTNGTGPWFENTNTDQAFITYMETDIGAGVSLVKVAGNSYSEVRAGPSGDEYVFNVSGVTKDVFGIWSFAITNANGFPVTFNWTADVHSDTYPQLFGLRLSTEAGEVPYYTYAGTNTSLDGYRWLPFTAGLGDILDGAPVAYTAPNGLEFSRVNVTVNGTVTGGMVLSGLRVRYYLDVEISGPDVVAAADAFRAANEHLPEAMVPFVVTSSVSARVLLSDPLIDYDRRPNFNTKTQILEEDGYGEEDLDTLFGDDYDNNNLTYTVVGVDVEDAIEAEVNGSTLMMTPEANWTGELDLTVRGADSTGQHVDGVIKVVVEAINDPPVIDLEVTSFEVQARVTLTLDLSNGIYDVDDDQENLTLTTDSGHITVVGMVLYCTFDKEGEATVEIKVTDGLENATADLTFDVAPPVGYPSIVGLPEELKVPVNRPLPMDLVQYGEDPEDASDQLTWTVAEDSDLFDVELAADGFNLTITATGEGFGTGTLTMTLTDTEDHSTVAHATVNITERWIEPPRINHDALPDRIDLKEGGESYELDLADYVEDETPIEDLVVTITYSKEGIVYVDPQAGVLTYVPQGLGRSNVTVTLTDTDGEASTFSIDVEVKSDSEDEPINWTLWIVLLFVLVIIVVLIVWPRKTTAPAAAPGAPAAIDVDGRPKGAPPAPRVDKVVPHTFSSSALMVLEEVLLFHSSELLISQYTRGLKEGVDADLEGAVISSIQEHIKGRMRTRDEPTDIIELEGMLVVIERGADVALAAVLSGAEPEGLRMHLRTSLNEVQTRNAGVLPDWDGNLAELRGIDNAMIGLVESLIREHNGAQDLSVDGETTVLTPHRHPRPVVDGIPELEDEDDPLKLVKDIIGEEKAHEIEEGHHHEEPPEEGGDEEKSA